MYIRVKSVAYFAEPDSLLDSISLRRPLAHFLIGIGSSQTLAHCVARRQLWLAYGGSAAKTILYTQYWSRMYIDNTLIIG